MTGLKLRGVSIEPFTAADAAALAAAINTWKANAGEKTLVELLYNVDATGHHALLLYSGS